MKTKYLLTGLALCSAVAYAVVQPAQRMRVSMPMVVGNPAIGENDSTDNNGKMYTDLDLIDTRVNTNLKTLQTDSVTTPDGVLKVYGLRNGPMLSPIMRVLGTRLRSDRYTEGSLKIRTVENFVVMVDGKEVGRRTDSITSIKLNMQPYQDYELTVKMLVNLPQTEIQIGYEPAEGYEDATVTIDSEQKRRMRVGDVNEGMRTQSVAISPDGRYTLLTFANQLAPHNMQYTAQVVETATGNVIVGDVNPQAQWLPKTNAIYYPRKKADGYDIISLSIPDMKTRTLAENVEEGNVQFGPTEEWILYYRTVEGKKDTGDLRRVKSPDDRIPGDRDRSVPVLQWLKRGVAQPLTFGSRNVTVEDVSPDGRHLLLGISYVDETRWPFAFQSLVEMNTIPPFMPDTIIADSPDLRSACYSPDGKDLFITGAPDMFDGIGRNLGEEPIANTYDLQGYIYNRETGNVRAMTVVFAPAINDSPVWNRADGCIYFSAVAGFDVNIYRLNPKDGKIAQIPAEEKFITDYSIGDRQARYLVYTGSSPKRMGAAYAYDLKTRKNVMLANPRSEWMDETEFGAQEKWVHTTSDGTSVDGEFCLPPDFDPSKKYPLIVYYNGGTSPSDHRANSVWNPHLFASRGYVCYVLNPSGTTGYGQEYSARHVNAWGKRTANEIIECVKAFCKDHPFIDEKKVGCLGASYGGFMTMYLQTLTDIFAAAISHAGISNVTSYWGEGYWGYSYNALAAAKSYPWTDPKLFTEQGALFNADKIHTPLLLLHGKVDTNVPIGESIQMFNALRILGRDVEFITVEDTNHGVTEYEKRRQWQNTIMAWFDKWLKDNPAWWDSMYGN